MTQRITDSINRHYTAIFEDFQRLNRTPEVLFDLPNTARLLRHALERVPDLEVHDVPGATSCMVAIMRNGAGPVIAYRTDMDALPITDLTDTPWRSERAGFSHACGHSTHMATAIMIAHTMSDLRDTWSGTLLIYCQACEENGTREWGSGAQRMIEVGLFEHFPVPERILAIHCDPFRPVGTVRLCKGIAFAHTSFFELTVRGRAAHGGMPFRGGIDTIVMASRIVEGIQSIVSRELNPRTEPAVVSVGSIHAGDAPNAIPATAFLKGTIRCFGEEVYHKVCAAIERTANGVAQSMGMPAAEWPTLYRNRVYAPQLINDPAMGDQLESAYRSVLAHHQDVEISDHAEFYGEDFANYGLTAHQIKIFLTWVGSVAPHQFDAQRQPLRDLPPLHDGHYTPYWHPEAPTDTLRTAALTQTAGLIQHFNVQQL
jgi:amidohydrolase